jgi:hypothetical protein
MQYADDSDANVDRFVKQHIVADRKLPQFFSVLAGGLTHQWIPGQSQQVSFKPINHSVGRDDVVLGDI